MHGKGLSLQETAVYDFTTMDITFMYLNLQRENGEAFFDHTLKQNKISHPRPAPL
jgi:hypothetical protein